MNGFGLFTFTNYTISLDLGKDVAEGKVALQKHVINKSLTKAPADYPDKRSQPHVRVIWCSGKFGVFISSVRLY